jgi:LysM repeat protein
MRKLVLIFVFLLILVGVANADGRGGDVSYTVRPGDTITGIANAFGVDADAILIRNNIIDPNRIRVGQVLIIPTGAVTVPRSHVVAPAERLTDIAIRYNTTVDELIALNQLGNPNYLIPGQVIILPATQGPATFARTYRVDIGDTLRSIGARFGVSWQQLAAYNNIWNPNYIQAGMLINIPPVDYVPAGHPPAGDYYPPAGDYYPPAPHPLTYIVQRGDVLEFISQHFGVSVEAIRERNGLNKWDPIFPGQVLIIPSAGYPPTHYEPPPYRFNGWYTVRAGDTLFRIAARFHVNIYDLAEANGILNLNSIYAGQSLRIPGY